MAKEKTDGQENLTLKKIRYYQGTIKDYETYWNDRITQDDHELSQETKACRDRNEELNKAFDIVPVTADDENTSPEPLTDKEKKEIEGEKKCKDREDKKDKDSDDKKDDKSDKDKKDDKSDDKKDDKSDKDKKKRED